MIDYLRRDECIDPGSDKIIIGNKIERKIFEKIKMHPLEYECLKNLKLILSQMPPLRLPKYWQDSDYLRVLAFHDYDIAKSAQGLVLHLSWVHRIDLSIQPNELLVNFIQISQLNGVLYVNGFDKGFRPVIIINLQKALEYTLLQFQQAFDFLLCLIIRDVLISFYIESVVIMIDVNTHHLKISNSFSAALLNYIKSSQLNFYGRIHKIYILHEITKDIFYPYLNVLKPEFEEKTIVLEKKDIIQLQKQIDPQQLEQKFLGFSKNLQNNFWPPKNPTKSAENNVLKIQVDDSQSKSNNIVSIYKNESNQSSQFTLQVYNEENEIISSEIHQFQGDESVSELPEYYPDSILFAENSGQVSMECVLQELTSSYKALSSIQKEKDSQLFLEQRENTNQQTYKGIIKPNCNMESCQLM
ncbi:unnamed protein product (macronuclear) [Paramecium tetraurelia]|uniref:CRAL-TRIO domain-containing protein n=1 Tax=Paramecium tetraurelia TaxID=5888 RepID=A0CDQ3_PARTE|nr:uncharacterized protein GSPATT00007132001 [Paramecium tetraurelia]CAK68920.1 unnamed protein product [Paramecium tetraurelia]|eukprot:XP_001436317.1 hypothetical protein (macronuclear) [Paramecium tetraurelia strain d4-2]